MAKKKIRHDYGQTKSIRFWFPRSKRYRFRFLSPRVLCMIAIVYAPLFSYLTLIWLTIILALVYCYNSFFTDHCDRLLYSTINTIKKPKTNGSDGTSASAAISASASREPSCISQLDENHNHSNYLNVAKQDKFRWKSMSFSSLSSVSLVPTQLQQQKPSSTEIETSKRLRSLSILPNPNLFHDLHDHVAQSASRSTKNITNLVNSYLWKPSKKFLTKTLSNAKNRCSSPILNMSDDGQNHYSNSNYDQTNCDNLTVLYASNNASSNDISLNDTTRNDYSDLSSSIESFLPRSRAFSQPDILTSNIITASGHLSHSSISILSDRTEIVEVVSPRNLYNYCDSVQDLTATTSHRLHQELDLGNDLIHDGSLWSPMKSKWKKLRKNMQACMQHLPNRCKVSTTTNETVIGSHDSLDQSFPQPHSNVLHEKETVKNSFENLIDTVEERITKSASNFRKRFMKGVSQTKSKSIDNLEDIDENSTDYVGVSDNALASRVFENFEELHGSIETLMPPNLLPTSTSEMDLTFTDKQEAVPLSNAQQNHEGIMKPQQMHNLLQYPFFLCDVHLKRGENLPAKDSNGSSDPFIKFKIGNQCLHKSQVKHKTLNPVWDEYFVLPIENISKPLKLKAYDHDYFFTDDFIGSAQIDLTKLEPGINTELELYLKDDHSSSITNLEQASNHENESGSETGCGKIIMTIRLNPKTSEERKNYFGRGKWTTVPGSDGQANKRIKAPNYESIVSVVLIKGDNIELDSDYGIRMKLGAEKFKSKIVSKTVTQPYWAEQFEMHLYATQSKMLEITMITADQQMNFIEKVCTDLSQLEKERAHHIVHKFDLSQTSKMIHADPMAADYTKASCKLQTDPMPNAKIVSGKKQCTIEMLITITGTASSNIPATIQECSMTASNSNLSQQQQNLMLLQPMAASSTIPVINSCEPPEGWDSGTHKLLDMNDIFNMSKFCENFLNVGTLMVKVHRAENLASADLNGKSDPFCVLELVNERLRTNTEYKTLSPEWNKMFKFQIKDINDILELTVYDEDNNRADFLGKIAIPLLKIHNGEKRWYALKDKKLRNRVKGHILLECWVSYSKLKAGVLTLTPRSNKYIQSPVKFKRTLLIRNAMRLKNIGMELMEMGQFLHSCIQWESPSRSILALSIFLFSVFYFEFYMIPMVIILFIAMNWFGLKACHLYDSPEKKKTETETEDEEFLDDNYDFCGDDKEAPKSLKEKIQAFQEISTFCMTLIGQVASYIERFKNASNFTVPYLTYLAVVCLTICAIILYIIPFRYIVLIWGIDKFTKKFRCPNAVNNNEILDFLSRVPDMEEKLMYTEYKPSIQYDLADGETPSSNLQHSNSTGAITTASMSLHRQPGDYLAEVESNSRHPTRSPSIASIFDRRKRK